MQPKQLRTIVENWTSFLQDFGRTLVNNPQMEEVFELSPKLAEAGKQQWFGQPPASKAMISKAEQELKTELPKSYREFLLTTNGWDLFSYSPERIRSVEEIGWLRDFDPKFIHAWLSGVGNFGPSRVSDEVYFVYGTAQDVCAIRDEYFYECLQISDKTDGAFLLLNPVIRDENGEWEAWEFASWRPGAIRYRSFSDLMQAQLERQRKYAAEAG